MNQIQDKIDKIKKPFIIITMFMLFVRSLSRLFIINSFTDEIILYDYSYNQIITDYYLGCSIIYVIVFYKKNKKALYNFIKAMILINIIILFTYLLNFVFRL